MEEIIGKLLKGLKFRTSEGREIVDENGKKKTKFIPIERALKPGDVLSWKDKGDVVVIVAKDGTKHTVAKEAAEDAAKGKAGKETKGGDDGAA